MHMTEHCLPLDTYDTGGAFSFLATPLLRDTMLAQGCTGINVDLERLYEIAEHMDIVSEGELLPPLMMLGRIASSATFETPRDIQWERDQAELQTFCPLADLTGPRLSYSEIKAYARSLGITNMHQIDITPIPGASHVESMARALAMSVRRINAQRLTAEGPLNIYSENSKKRSKHTSLQRQLANASIGEPISFAGISENESTPLI